MKILVTGGCGFIGSNFIRVAIDRYPHYKFINLDKLTYAGNLKNLKNIEKYKNYKFIKGDICNAKLINKITKDIDVIFHFAAESHVDRSIKNPKIFTKSNVLGTNLLLEAARINNIKKFIHISTDEVYGSIKEGSFNEKSTLKPNNPYAASKASSDLIALAYYHTYGLSVIIARGSNNFGPYQYPEKLIPFFINNLIKNKKVPIYGWGKNVRDWIYVCDNCDAIELVFKKGKKGEIYNISGGNEKTNMAIAQIILKSLGKGESYIKHVNDRPGHDFRYSMDCSKIKGLGWKPKFNFDLAIIKTIEWYKNNEDWLKQE